MLISAFVFGGIPEDAVKKVFKESEVLISYELLKEYRDTPFELKEEGKIAGEQFKALLSGIASFVVNAKTVIPNKELFICRDAKDNMVLECCLAGKAEFLITGDKDLLEMDKGELKKELPDLKIVSPKTFLHYKK